jgi:hypothetical protein
VTNATLPESIPELRLIISPRKLAEL